MTTAADDEFSTAALDKFDVTPGAGNFGNALHKFDWADEIGLSCAAAADGLGVSRTTVPVYRGGSLEKTETAQRRAVRTKAGGHHLSISRSIVSSPGRRKPPATGPFTGMITLVGMLDDARKKIAAEEAAAADAVRRRRSGAVQRQDLLREFVVAMTELGAPTDQHSDCKYVVSYGRRKTIFARCPVEGWRIAHRWVISRDARLYNLYEQPERRRFRQCGPPVPADLSAVESLESSDFDGSAIPFGNTLHTCVEEEARKADQKRRRR